MGAGAFVGVSIGTYFHIKNEMVTNDMYKTGRDTNSMYVHTLVSESESGWRAACVRYSRCCLFLRLANTLFLRFVRSICSTLISRRYMAPGTWPKDSRPFPTDPKMRQWAEDVEKRLKQSDRQ
jgi:hypothetical protein